MSWESLGLAALAAARSGPADRILRTRSEVQVTMNRVIKTGQAPVMLNDADRVVSPTTDLEALHAAVREAVTGDLGGDPEPDEVLVRVIEAIGDETEVATEDLLELRAVLAPPEEASVTAMTDAAFEVAMNTLARWATPAAGDASAPA